MSVGANLIEQCEQSTFSINIGNNSVSDSSNAYRQPQSYDNSLESIWYNPTRVTQSKTDTHHDADEADTFQCHS